MDERVKELLGKARLTAEAAMGAAAQVAGTVAQRGEKMVGKTRRSLRVLDLNNEIELLMRDIGRMVYLTHTGTETDEQALQSKLEKIDEKYAAIAGIKEQQAALRTTMICPVCGKIVDKGDLYCRICGEKLQ